MDFIAIIEIITIKIFIIHLHMLKYMVNNYVRVVLKKEKKN